MAAEIVETQVQNGHAKPATRAETWIQFLSSNRLAIYTLIGIGVVTLIGTIVPQRGPGLDEARFHALAASGGYWGLVARLGFLDIFHSAWFYGLIAILTINMSVCTTLNFGRVLRTSNTKNIVLEPALVSRIGSVVRFKAKNLSPERIREVVRPTMEKIADGASFYFADRGNIHRFGAIVSHVAIFVMIGGAVYGSLFGIDGSMPIPEGASESVITLRRGGELALPFAVRCNDFDLEYYEGSSQPKTFRSSLTFLTGPDRAEAKTTPIEVNIPAEFGGYRFFQSSYGQLPPQAIVRVTPRGADAAVREMSVSFGEAYRLPDGGRFAVVNMDRDKFGGGLAIQVREMNASGASSDFWVFKDNPKFDASRAGDFGYEFVELRNDAYYTGLMVTKNPGINVFWLGCAIGAVGLYLAFAIKHRRTLVYVKDGEVAIAYHDSAGHDAQADALEAMKERLLAKN
ncbi:cytochrome c biogenesis protein ResB [bacterium]|nr:cytochrome c biogenesis protein ResB [bacterium]